MMLAFPRMRNLVMGYLLTKADPRPGIERNKNEGVRSQILMQTAIKEPVGIKLKS